jgi:hypothetical protein
VEKALLFNIKMRIDNYFHSFLPNAGFSRSEKWYLLSITLFGAVIRFVYLNNRPFVLDEIGTHFYIEKDIPYLLSHYATWLTMNYYIVAEKLVAALFGKSQLSLGLISLVAGIATIPLTATLARLFASSRVSLIAAVLISVNPYLISFSAIIRSYSLLVALSLIVMILFFKWHALRTYKNGILVGLGCYILILAHINGMYTVIYLLFTACAGFVLASQRREYFRSLLTVLLPVVVTSILIYASYIRILPEMISYLSIRHSTPPTSISYIPYIFTQYFSGGFFAWVSAATFIAGVLASHKYEKPLLILLPSIFLPMMIIAAQGFSGFPWGYARFLIFIVPLIVIFIAEGIDHYAGKFFSEKSLLPAVAFVILLILSWTPQIMHIFDEKSSYPWHEAADFIKKHYAEGDVIVGSDWKEPFHLRPYFSERSYQNVELNSATLKYNAFGTDSAAKIYFVASAHTVETSSPTASFGKIQVVTYTNSLGKSAAQIIRDDLVKTVKKGDALVPELAVFYKNIWDINNRIGEEKDNFYYYNLWIKCFELTERQRNIPYWLQVAEARNFISNIINTKAQ